ncbi:MAG TPA: hypothetical protein VD810_05030 [Methylophilaceae bacterium]|nr:hypothetical protein [Methylophilaceae bacterium]
MRKTVLAALLLTFAVGAQAKAPFKGKDYSGIYSCTGSNELVGDYEVKVTLKLNPISSQGRFGAYEYATETSNGSKYAGQAIADRHFMAISFQFNGKSVSGRGHSIGHAIFDESKQRPTFHKRYYEPDDNGGNYGYERCVFSEPLPESEKAAAAAAPAKSK